MAITLVGVKLSLSFSVPAASKVWYDTEFEPYVALWTIDVVLKTWLPLAGAHSGTAPNPSMKCCIQSPNESVVQAIPPLKYVSAKPSEATLYVE